MHRGLDIAAKQGTAINAADGGKVSIGAGKWLGRWLKLIMEMVLRLDMLIVVSYW